MKESHIRFDEALRHKASKDEANQLLTKINEEIEYQTSLGNFHCIMGVKNIKPGILYRVVDLLQNKGYHIYMADKDSPAFVISWVNNRQLSYVFAMTPDTH